MLWAGGVKTAIGFHTILLLQWIESELMVRKFLVYGANPIKTLAFVYVTFSKQQRAADRGIMLRACQGVPTEPRVLQWITRRARVAGLLELQHLNVPLQLHMPLTNVLSIYKASRLTDRPAGYIW